MTSLHSPLSLLNPLLSHFLPPNTPPFFSRLLYSSSVSATPQTRLGSLMMAVKNRIGGPKSATAMTKANTPICCKLQWSLIQTAVLVGVLMGAAAVKAGLYLSRPRAHKGLFLRKRPQRKCPKCAGFGVCRCSLCDGVGVVHAGKPHVPTTPCPQCIMTRFIRCKMCKGTGARPKLNRSPSFISNGKINVHKLIEVFGEWRRQRSFDFDKMDYTQSAVVLGLTAKSIRSLSQAQAQAQAH